MVLRQTGVEPGPVLGWGSLRAPQFGYSVYQYAAVDARPLARARVPAGSFDWDRADAERDHLGN